MPQQGVDGTDVSSAFQQMRSERMPQGVRRYFLVIPCFTGGAGGRSSGYFADYTFS